MNETLALVCLLLAPLAAAGLALIHQGLGRSRSAAHTMLATLCAMGVAAVVFVAVGTAWVGTRGGAAHVFTAGGLGVDWLGAEPPFAAGATTVRRLLELAFELAAVSLVAMIPVSAGGDRWRLASICCVSAVLAAVVFPLWVHWVWGGGWLNQLGGLVGLPGFADPGGAAVVQVTGGLAALSVAWIVGPRKGKYHLGQASAIPGHHIVLALFGCMVTLVGFIGLEGAAVLLFGPPEAGVLEVARVAVDAALAASSGLLAALATTRVRYRKPDASISANGWVAGLVAGSAGACYFSPAQTILVGAIAGVLVAFLVEQLELTLLVDDPGGAISVHAGAGLWGMLAFGWMGPAAAGMRGAHLLTELVGIATVLGILFPLLHGVNLLLNRLLPFRVGRDGDWQGMDIAELGSGAYPEFVVHADEFVPR